MHVPESSPKKSCPLLAWSGKDTQREASGRQSQIQVLSLCINLLLQTLPTLFGRLRFKRVFGTQTNMSKWLYLVMKVQWKWKKRAWSLRGQTTSQHWKSFVSSSLMSMEFKQWRYLAGKKDRSVSSLYPLVVSSIMIGRGIKSTQLLISTTSTRSTTSNKWFVPHATNYSKILWPTSSNFSDLSFSFWRALYFFMEVYIPGLPHCGCLATIASETLFLLDGLGRRPLQV